MSCGRQLKLNLPPHYVRHPLLTKEGFGAAASKSVSDSRNAIHNETGERFPCKLCLDALVDLIANSVKTLIDSIVGESNDFNS